MKEEVKQEPSPIPPETPKPLSDSSASVAEEEDELDPSLSTEEEWFESIATAVKKVRRMEPSETPLSHLL